MIIFTAIGMLINSTARVIIKLAGGIEDTVDMFAVTVAEARKDALEDAGITEEQLNATFENRLKPLKAKKPRATE